MTRFRWRSDGPTSRIAGLLGGTVSVIEPARFATPVLGPRKFKAAALRGVWNCWQEPAPRWSTKEDASPAITRACHLLPDGICAAQASTLGSIAETNRKLVYPILQRSAY